MKIPNAISNRSFIYKWLIFNSNIDPWIYSTNGIRYATNPNFIKYAKSLGIHFKSTKSYDTIIISDEDYFLFLLRFT